ncbi:MAG: polysulfide reductase NrfD [Acidobacteriota bacterium]|nr:MAG: polysulfide reductase NrfD [Acidobacteriota bacterium]
MFEITTTRANPMVDPALHVWGWEIPVYLFLGGLVAGMMIISGYLLFRGGHRNVRSAALMLPGVSVAMLTAGMLALYLDLEHKPYFWRLYTSFEPLSPMSWGAWILALVYPALIANLLLRVPGRLARRWPWLAELSGRLVRHQLAVRVIGAANLFLGVLLGVYTGVLLSALGARPLWNSALLGPLFLVSGLSTAAAFVHIIAPDPLDKRLLARADNVFLASELMLIVLLIAGLLTATRAHIDAAAMLLGGAYGAAFWVLVVGLGIVVPLVIQTLAVSQRIRHTQVAPVLVLAGGLALRFVIVYAGQASRWPVAS